MNYKEKKTKECFTFLRYAHARDSEIMLFNASPLSSEDEFKTSHTLDQKVAVRICVFCRACLIYICDHVAQRAATTESETSQSSKS